jgi:hypothetical protein
MTTQVPEAQNPQATPPPPGFFENPNVRHAHWEETLAKFKAAESAAQPATPQPAAAAPDVNDMKVLELTAQTKLANGTAAILDPRAARVIEKHRALVLGGQRLDQAAAKAELQQALGLPVTAAAKAEAPPAPAGSPEDRAFEEAAARLDTGEFIPVSELPAEMLCGYRVELPDGFGLNGESVSMLRTAREAGIPQSVVDKFIRARIAEELEE